MKVIVFGSRTWPEPTTVKHRLRQLPAGTIIVHGDSPGGGADALADFYGRALGFQVIPVPINADDRQKAARTRAAPIYRNLRLLDEHPDADLAIGFWDGKSPGSRHMVNALTKRGIPVEIVSPKAPA